MSLAPGTVFSDYRVASTMAESDSGALFVADQISTGRRLSLKVMKGTLASSAWDRFVQDAQIGGRLGSPAIATVVAAGVDPKSQVPWVAFEPFEGETLGSSIRRRGAIPPNEAYEGFKHVFHALAAAHAGMVVHRGLEPEVIVLTWKPSFGAKVLDIGLAKVLSEAKSGDTSTMMTPIWTAPELGDGKAQIGPQTDVWSLGLLVFFALTGRVFWKDPKFIPSLIQEMLFNPIPSASSRAHELGVGGIPPGFDGWFARCVEREPSGRFADAAQAWAALEPILRGIAGGSGQSSPSMNAVSSPAMSSPAMNAMSSPGMSSPSMSSPSMNAMGPSSPGMSSPSMNAVGGSNPSMAAQSAPRPIAARPVASQQAGLPVWLFAVLGVVLGLVVAFVIYLAAS